MHKHRLHGIGKAPGQAGGRRRAERSEDREQHPTQDENRRGNADDEDEEGWAEIARDEDEYRRRRPVHDWEE